MRERPWRRRLEESEFTGKKDRIDDLAARESKSADTHAWERSRRRSKSGWLSPLEINERTDPVERTRVPLFVERV
ncbi:MAG: hypothetical protein R3C28_33025 [Pirellulaceae bacterium]